MVSTAASGQQISVSNNSNHPVCNINKSALPCKWITIKVWPAHDFTIEEEGYHDEPYLFLVIQQNISKIITNIFSFVFSWCLSND